MQTRRSAWAEMSPLKWLWCWLIVPIIIANVVARAYRVSLTDKKITVSSGILNKRMEEYALAGITRVSVEQSFFGQIFNYGTVVLYLAGDKSVYLSGIMQPSSVRDFVNKKLTKTASAEHILVN